MAGQPGFTQGPYVADNTIRWSEDGRPYVMLSTGQRHYLPPVAVGGSSDPRLREWARSQGSTQENPTGGIPGGGFVRGAGEWNSETGQYEQPWNGGNLLSLAALGTIAGSYGIPALLSEPTVAEEVAGVAAAGTPGAAGAAGGGTLGRVLSGAGSAANRTLGLRDYLGLGLAGAGLANGLRTPPAQKGLEEMLGLATDRVNSSRPLFDALQAMAYADLPSYAKGGQ